MTPSGEGNVTRSETISAGSRRSFDMAGHSGIYGRAAIMVWCTTTGKASAYVDPLVTYVIACFCPIAWPVRISHINMRALGCTKPVIRSEKRREITWFRLI